VADLEQLLEGGQEFVEFFHDASMVRWMTSPYGASTSDEMHHTTAQADLLLGG
jgi:hypothetical protein